MDKQQLLDEIDRGFRDWRAAIAAVPPERLAEPGVAGEWSVKDLVAHVAFYEWWTAEFIRTRDWPVVPAAVDSPDAEVRNAAYFALRRDDPADVILDEAMRWHDDLVAAIAAASEAEAADTSRLGMPPGDAWRFENLVSGATTGHYPEHAATIRDWLGRTTSRL